MCLPGWACLLPECSFSDKPHLVTAWLQGLGCSVKTHLEGGVHEALDNWFLLWESSLGHALKCTLRAPRVEPQPPLYTASPGSRHASLPVPPGHSSTYLTKLVATQSLGLLPQRAPALSGPPTS